MKHQPYFNNPRVRQISYQGPPRNRAERRAMAKSSKKRNVQGFSTLSRLKAKTKDFQPHEFKAETYKIKSQAYKHKTNEELLDEYQRFKFEEAITKREERQAEYQAKRQPAVQLNEALEYASSIYGGNSEYTKYLIPLMRQLMGDDYLPEAGDKTTYFTISKDYTGNPNELFRYVHFKTIPRGTEYVDKMLELDWSSPENYYSHLADINAQRYSSNLTDSGFTPEVIDLLEYIMNTSAAWRIAKRNAQDSDQVKSNWLTLFSTAQEAQGAGSNVMNKFVQMVMNEEDLGIIMQTIDTMIYSAVKE